MSASNILWKFKQYHFKLCFVFANACGLGKTEDEDTRHLRHVMCEEMVNKFEEYRQWLCLTAEKLSGDASTFREQGWFNSDAGDIAVKVCSNILQISFIVDTSYSQAPYQSFVPPIISSTEPIYVV